MAQEIWIRIFGAPTVTADGENLAISRTRVRALLWLLVGEDRAIDRERIGYLLWPEESARVAQRNLSTHLSYLKKALGADALSIAGETVALSDTVHTDLRAFNKLASSNRTDDALAALDLVAGQAIEGFSLRDNEAFEQWQSSLRLVLNRHIIALTCRTARKLTEEGRPETACTILERAQSLDPFNEEICQLSMGALCALGQRQQAIRLYHELVDSLSSELGVPPTKQTVCCYQEIIGSDETYLASMRSSLDASSRQREMPFVGRESALQLLLANKTARFLLVQGKSGFGKTRLAREYLRVAGVRSIVAQAAAQESSVPLSLVRSILRAALEKIGESAIRSTVTDDKNRNKTLHFLLPELNIAGEDASNEKLISQREVAVVLGTVLEQFDDKGDAVLFVDDLHHADAASLRVLGHLYSNRSFAGPRLMTALRPSLANPDLLSFLNAMERSDPSVLLELGKLSSESMHDLLSCYCPDTDCVTSEKFIDLADGNPYWLKCIMRGLDDGYTELSGANSLLSLFGRALRSLSAPARQTAQLLALHGGCCDPELFSLWCSERESSSNAVFSELAAARLVSRNDAGQVSIAHSKVLDFILDDLDPARISTMQLEYELACSLASCYDGFGSASLVIVDHFMKSCQPGAALPYAFAAGNHLIHIDDAESAIRYYKIAYQYGEGEEKLCCGLALMRCFIDTDQPYELSLYAKNALDYAETHDWYSYTLAFKAIQSLTQLPEYHELRKYTYPSYRISPEPSVAALMEEMVSFIAFPVKNPYLASLLPTLAASYHLLVGNTDAAKEELQQSVSSAVGAPENTRRSYLPLLHLHSMILLITTLNYTEDTQVAGALHAEQHLYDDIPLNQFAVSALESKALNCVLKGRPEEGMALMKDAILLARDIDDAVYLAQALTVQALLVRNVSRTQSFALNYEAYCVAKQHGLRFVLVRSLIGLVKTSPSHQDARQYFDELRSFCEKIGDRSPLRKVAAFIQGT